MRLGLVVVVCGLVGLAGCSGGVVGGNLTEGSQTAGVAGPKLTGAVHGGQNPISGAQVYLFAAASGAGGAGAAAYGGSGIAASSSNASVSLLTSGTLDQSGGATNGDYYVTTGSDGNFSISGDYTCTAGQEVYLYAPGGDPGLGTGAKAAAGLMAVLGSCPTGGNFLLGTSPVTYVVVNEVSTVAAAYAMAGFATDALHVGSSGTALAQVGIANAFANAANLETIGTGVALAKTPAGNGTVPQAEINTLANILAACVNSNGTGLACSTLFANAESGGTTGTVATDTATAAINIAHNPGAGVSALYGLGSGTPAFAGGLTAQPNDWTLAIFFTEPGVSATTAIAIDGTGNAWFGDGPSNSIVELSSSGILLSGTSGYTAGGMHFPEMIAIDQSGNAWVTGFGMPKVVEISPNGSVLSGANGFLGYNVFDENSLETPSGIAVDGAGNVWVPNEAGNAGVSEFANSGTFIGWIEGMNFSLDVPTGAAVDASNVVWTANFADNTIGIFSGPATTYGAIGGFATGGGLNEPDSVAIDGWGNVWVANEGNNSVTKMSYSGTFFSGAGGFIGSGLVYPECLVVDGAGNVWVGGFTSKNIVEFSNSGAVLSGPVGYRSGDRNAVEGIAVDGSGNVWATSDSSSVSEIVGAAVPVVTPIAVGVTNNMLGTRP